MSNRFEIVFALAAIAMVAIGAIGLMQIGQEEIESPGFILETTETEEIENAGWVGGGSAGVSPDGEKREVFTRTAYILSHRGNGQSQDITVQGRVQIIPPGLFECVLDDARYILSLSKDGIVYEEWQRFKFQLPTAALQAGQWLDLQSWTVNVVGFEAIGAIRVNLEGFCFAGTWVDLADDWAYLRDGVGGITASKQAAVGETITVTWQIPYITAEGGAGASGTGVTGWFLIGNHLDTGKQIVNMKLNSLQGNFKYTVQQDDFVPGAAGDCADNIIRWRLLNELWNVDWRDTTTIDVAGAGPVVTNLKWDKTNYITGDTATLTWDVELGPEGFPIDSQKVVWGFQEPIQEVDLNATERIFTTEGLGQAGEVQGEVIAYDTACRPSAVANTFASVSDPNQPPTPPGGEETNLLIIAIAATIAILLAILVVFLLNPVIPGPTIVKVIILIIIGILAALALFFLFQAIGTAIANAFMIGGMK